MMEHKNIHEALKILEELGLPREQRNERSALCLLALLNLTPDKSWSQIENPLIGITPIMNFSRKYYGKEYAPNTRETFRRQTMHQFVAAGIALYNPDNPNRPINSPKTVYQIESKILKLLQEYGMQNWNKKIKDYLSKHQTLAASYAKERELKRISLHTTDGKKIQLSPGAHNNLIKSILEEFAPRFVPGGVLIYVGDTGNKWNYFNRTLLAELGVHIDAHGKMPDVVLYFAEKNWLILIESVTSHGPVDGKRHAELLRLFSEASPGLVYVTAFPSRSVMARYLSNIAWETEVWVAEAPSHLIHFNGIRFLGPYADKSLK